MQVITTVSDLGAEYGCIDAEKAAVRPRLLTPAIANGDRRGLMVSAPTAHRVDLGSIPSFGHFRIGQFFRKNRMLYNQKKWLLHIRRRGTSANFRSGHRAMTARNNKATNRDSKLSSRKCRQ